MDETRRRQILGGWAGMIGSVVFVVTFTVEGALRPGYRALGMYISELSLGSLGWIQVLNFITLGVLILAFAWGVAAEFSDGRASRAGPALLAMMGVCFCASGPFVMDPADTPPAALSLSGWVHNILGGIIFTLAPVTCFVFFRRFGADPRWRPIATWTVAAGILMTIVNVLWKVLPARPPTAPNTFNAWLGLFQRAVIVPFLGWTFAVAYRMTKAGVPGRTAKSRQ